MTEYIVEMKQITKSFPGVLALDHVDFSVRSGEVMALLGENGAGKSTLVKILSGVHTRDEGEIYLYGKEHKGDITPVSARELGIAIIHQELNMCSHLSVAENIFLGREICKSGMLLKKEMNNQAFKILDRLKINIHPETIVGSLAISKQQMVEIAKALSTDAKILIMDEPTSALTNKEIKELFSIIHTLRDEGRSIIYISHRLDELQHIVDRVTIMRDGKFVLCDNYANITMEIIISNMVGREIKEKFPRVKCPVGKKILSVKNLNAGRMVRDINFDLYGGEIVGVAGLMGAGRTEMTRALFGIDHKASGEIFLEDKEITIKKPLDAINNGIVLAPEDRKKDGLCTGLSVRDNIALPNLDMLCNKLSVVNHKKETKMVDEATKKFSIRMPNSDVSAASLSGGNQQKVVVAKWLARNSKVVIFDEPTRGIDVAAKVEIYNLMNQLKQQGIGVLFTSSEMPEILGISDRTIVMCDGRITGELNTAEATQNKILEFATRFEKKLGNEQNT